MHYFDNAATTKLDIDAFESMKHFMLEEYGNASQPYSFSRSARKALKEARKSIANCINAEENEIYFTSGGTESDNFAIKGFYDSIPMYEKAHIVTSSFEHHAVLNACESVSEKGCDISYINPTNDGYILPNRLEKYLNDSNGLVSIMMVNNEIGTIQPIKELAEVAHKCGYLFHTDAVQAVGHLPIDVKELNVDILSASAHKFNGPKGIGFIYIKKGIKLNPIINGGSQELGLRAGTENVAAIVGMAIALNNNVINMQKNINYIKSLEERLMDYLSLSPISFIRNGGTNRVVGNISLSFKDLDGEVLLHRLDLLNCIISTGSACDGKKDIVSHVLEAINVPETYIKGTIRITLSKNNTINDIDILGESIVKVLNQLRKLV